MAYESDVKFEVYQNGSWVEYYFTSYKETYNDNGFGSADVYINYNTQQNINGEEEARLNDVAEGYVLFRGFLESAGELQEDGTIKVKIAGVGKEIMGELVDINLSSTDNHSAFTEAMSGTRYTVTTGGTSINIERYNPKDSRKIVLGELTRNYNYKAIFYPDLSVRYEPEGYRDSGESIDTYNDNNVLQLYEKGISRNKVTEVTIVSQDDAGNDTTASVSSGSGGKSITKRIDYPITNTQANSMANNLINNVLSSKARVKTGFWYRTKLVNQVVNIKNSAIGLDEDFVVRKQITYYPERTTILQLGLADDEDGIGNATERERELRNERSKLLGNTEENAGEQSLTGDGDHGNHPDDGHVQTTNSQTSFKSNVSVDYDFSQELVKIYKDDIPSDTYLYGYVPSGTVDYAIINGNITIEISTAELAMHDNWPYIGTIGATAFVEIVNLTRGIILFNEYVTITIPCSRTFLVVDSDADSGDEIRLRARVQDTDWTHSLGMDLTIDSVEEHDHFVDSVDTDSGFADIVAQLSRIDISGSTEQKLLNLLKDIKTNRN